MCENCGCSEPTNLHEHEHTHDGHTHSHSHTHDDHHHHDHNEGHARHESHARHDDGHPHEKKIVVESDILGANNLLAERNRGYFEAKKIVALNFVSSPGSGKTTILEETIKKLGKEYPMFVIEGDQQSNLDAERIDRAGAASVQINTGKGCHLDAGMIKGVLNNHQLKEGSFLFIENVGNLVCPAMFDLGEQKRVLIMSVTEGEDKPLKYPHMYRSSHLCLINKIDLLPYVDFSVEKAKEYALRINPELQFIEISARSGSGMEEWYGWMKELVSW
ncbi:MAG: hydrogenase nickel incorporation protein HypB [Bacteroidota bacterium]